MVMGVRVATRRGYAATNERGRMTEQNAAPRVQARDRDDRLKGTETKKATKTTELIVFVLTVVGILIASLLVDGDGSAGFGASDAWRYITYAAIGYMISRGLAKAGSRNPRDE